MSWLKSRARMRLGFVMAASLLVAMFVIAGTSRTLAAGPVTAHTESSVVESGEHNKSPGNADPNEEKLQDRSQSLSVTMGMAGLMLVIIGGSVVVWVRKRNCTRSNSC